MVKYIEERGNVYGDYEVFCASHKDKWGAQYWHVYCHHCGNLKIVRGGGLRSGAASVCDSKSRKKSPSHKNKLAVTSMGNRNRVGTKHSDITKKRISKSRRGKLTGEQNPNWNASLTKENREDKRNTPEYREWRQFVYERDHFTDPITGECGVEFEAHHIRNWIDNPELRYDTDNGITMTYDNHTLFHKIFGKKNNTYGQYLSFSIMIQNGVA